VPSLRIITLWKGDDIFSNPTRELEAGNDACEAMTKAKK
jgi:hypothetical protein